MKRMKFWLCLTAAAVILMGPGCGFRRCCARRAADPCCGDGVVGGTIPPTTVPGF